MRIRKRRKQGCEGGRKKEYFGYVKYRWLPMNTTYVGVDKYISCLRNLTELFSYFLTFLPCQIFYSYNDTKQELNGLPSLLWVSVLFPIT